MAQAIYCPSCKVFFTAELRGKSCPACGDELVHARVPSSKGGLGMRKRAPHASRAVWDHIIKRDPCVYCGCMAASTVDHILPKALGGSKGSWTNRAGSCFRCNQDKAHTPLLFFMLERVGINLSDLKDAEGDWPIPATDEQLQSLVVTQEELDARNAPRFAPYVGQVIEPEPEEAAVA